MKKIKNMILIFFIIFFTAILSIMLYSMYLGIEVDYTPNYDVERIVKLVEEKQENLNSIEDILDEATHSVVGISKLQSTGNSIFIEKSESKLGLGSGVIVSKNGYILTNQHVAGEKYSTCYITLENGKSYNGNVVWSDKDIDLAIVKINAQNLKSIKIGDSDNIKVAQKVYAIGNPVGFEFQRTVTAGIISGLNRTIRLSEEEATYMEDLIQTDATINEGNSGGPLLDSNGYMVGINTVKITSAEGIGFAVPINMVTPIIEKIEKTGEFNEAYLGIFGYDEDVIPYLDSNIDFKGGIYVAQVVLDGPCFNSGILEGDIITKIDNVEINNMSKLKNYIYKKEQGDEVVITVKRNNIELKFNITLGKKP